MVMKRAFVLSLVSHFSFYTILRLILYFWEVIFASIFGRREKKSAFFLSFIFPWRFVFSYPLLF